MFVSATALTTVLALASTVAAAAKKDAAPTPALPAMPAVPASLDVGLVPALLAQAGVTVPSVTPECATAVLVAAAPVLAACDGSAILAYAQSAMAGQLYLPDAAALGVFCADACATAIQGLDAAPAVGACEGQVKVAIPPMVSEFAIPLPAEVVVGPEGLFTVLKAVNSFVCARVDEGGMAGQYCVDKQFSALKLKQTPVSLQQALSLVSKTPCEPCVQKELQALVDLVAETPAADWFPGWTEVAAAAANSACPIAKAAAAAGTEALNATADEGVAEAAGSLMSAGVLGLGLAGVVVALSALVMA